MTVQTTPPSDLLYRLNLLKDLLAGIASPAVRSCTVGRVDFNTADVAHFPFVCIWPVSEIPQYNPCGVVDTKFLVAVVAASYGVNATENMQLVRAIKARINTDPTLGGNVIDTKVVSIDIDPGEWANTASQLTIEMGFEYPIGEG
jgi:hypothetical protein